MKTLFVTDLDGTLLTKEERVSAYSREILNRLIGSGMLFTFATARSVWSAQRALSGLDTPIPAIFYNGGLVYDLHSRRILRESVFGEDEKREVLSVLREAGVCPILYTVCDRTERVKWIGGSETEGMQRYFARRVGDGRLFPVRTDEELLEDRAFIFRCVGPADLMARAWDVLKFDPRFLCIYHRETYQSDFWLEISPREANKASAVTFLKEELGCGRVVCFGDSSNDSDMFDVCDEKYAVMNADAWLKEKATGVIGYCEEDGVAKWLEQNGGLA